MEVDTAGLAELDDAMDWAGIMEWLQDTWVHDYGSMTCHEKKTGGFDLELSTGGWSENENIIFALGATMFWQFFWQESRRGGYYRLKVCLSACNGKEITNDNF